MLVLSRQRDETIMIGDDIEITIVDIRGDKVRLGIAAPTRVAVHRKEVYEAIRAENQRAARIAGGEVMSVRPASAGPKGRPRSVGGASALAAGSPVRANPQVLRDAPYQLPQPSQPARPTGTAPAPGSFHPPR